MKQIIAVASGKGGVGKSTVAANLAVTFANHGENPKKVALVDVDFYGPSIPTLMGGGEISVNHEEKFIPASNYNVKYMSIAFFLKNPDDAIVWRGPMFSKAISQLFQDVDWGDVDLCFVDMPPGTGDAQLSLAQQMSIAGAVVVTTPQEVALTDVRRAINMFRKVNVNVLGVVENMAGLTLPDGSTLDVFGKGGGQKLASDYQVPFLGSLPIDISVREGGDSGKPSAYVSGSEASERFIELAAQLEEQLAKTNSPSLQVVN